MLHKADTIRLRHMADAARQALDFAAGRSRRDLDSDQMLTFALVRAIEIIGEAASQVTEDGRAAAPEIPWASIAGMRNRIVHAYFDIDLDRVWDTIADDLPPLLAQLGQILTSYRNE